MASLTIAKLAKAAGVKAETIRFYQRQGLLPLPARPLGGIRRYGGSDVARVRFIKSAQRLGFTLAEIGELLALEDGTHCAEARVLAEHKLDEVRRRVRDLQRIEEALNDVVRRCRGREGTVACPLIASLRDADTDG